MPWMCQTVFLNTEMTQSNNPLEEWLQINIVIPIEAN